MRLLLFNREEELLSGLCISSRSGGISFSSSVFLSSFFLLLGFLSRFCISCCRSSGFSCCSRLGVSFCSRFCSISSKNNGGEGNGYEGGYDCGQNFFHLYYLQRECVWFYLCSLRAKKSIFCNCPVLKAVARISLLISSYVYLIQNI